LITARERREHHNVFGNYLNAKLPGFTHKKLEPKEKKRLED